MNPPEPVPIGVGFDTARYGHHVSFLRPDLQPAAKPFPFTESAAGWAAVLATGHSATTPEAAAAVRTVEPVTAIVSFEGFPCRGI